MTLALVEASLVAESSTGEVSMPGPPVIQCQGLSKFFGAAPVLTDVSLSLEPGEILALVGPSGSGKTTFLRLVAGFETPDSGTVELEGRPVSGEGTWVPPESRRLGMVFQDYALFPHLTVFQNVTFGLAKMSRPAQERRAQEMLEMVRLSHLAQRYPYQLSGGEQQRVALARSLAPSPLALLLDEPFSNLDPQLRSQLREEVKDIFRSSRVTVVYVTHDQEEALFMGDRVAVIHKGCLQQVGTPEEVFHYPRSPFVAGFLGTADFLSAQATEAGLVTEIGTLRPLERPSLDSPYELMVRPDDVAIRSSETGAGRVESRVFRGTHYLYGLVLPSGAIVHSLQHHTAHYRYGERVEVYLERDQTLICFVQGREDESSLQAVTMG